MNSKIKDLLYIVGTLSMVLMMLAGAFAIGHEYGARNEHQKTQELASRNAKLVRHLDVFTEYYENAETLLDTLESRLNWLDRVDAGEAYDNYVQSYLECDNIRKVTCAE